MALALNMRRVPSLPLPHAAPAPRPPGTTLSLLTPPSSPRHQHPTPTRRQFRKLPPAASSVAKAMARILVLAGGSATEVTIAALDGAPACGNGGGGVVSSGA